MSDDPGRNDDREGTADDAAAPEAPFAGAIHIPYEIELPGFSGPLELLLHLIRKHKLDILDIPVGFVTEKYLEYIAAMEVLNLDIASEYLEMAATLTRIKSRMLLPLGESLEEQDAGEPEDPRAELVRRLLEYQKYRDAADQLWNREQLDRDVFVRRTDHAPTPSGERPLAEVGLGALLDAFTRVLQRVGADVAREVTVERVSVAQRIQELVELLAERRRVRFEQLFEGAATRLDLVVTFLALLEMTKLHMTRLLQAGLDTPLFVDFVSRSDGEIGEITSDQAPPDPVVPEPEPPAPAAEPTPAADGPATPEPEPLGGVEGPTSAADPAPDSDTMPDEEPQP